jgi:hypothetical protein
MRASARVIQRVWMPSMIATAVMMANVSASMVGFVGAFEVDHDVTQVGVEVVDIGEDLEPCMGCAGAGPGDAEAGDGVADVVAVDFEDAASGWIDA